MNATESRVAYPLRQRLFVWGDRWEDWCFDRLPDSARWPDLDNVPYTLNERAQRLFCRLLSHVPIGDQCGKPDHDFCAYCRTTMPGQAPRSAPCVVADALGPPTQQHPRPCRCDDCWSAARDGFGP